MAFGRRGRRDRPDRFERPERGSERGERFEGRDRPPGRGRFEGADRPGRGRFESPDRPQGRGRFEGADRPGRGRFGDQPGGRSDEAAMSLRLDPRRVQLLKQMAAETGMRPGELVLRWVQERIDAERAGGLAAAGGVASQADLEGRVDGSLAAELAALAARVDVLTRRVEELSAGSAGTAGAVASQAASDGKHQPEAAALAAEEGEAAQDADAEEPATAAAEPREEVASDLGGESAVRASTSAESEEPVRRRRGRPPKTPAADDSSAQPTPTAGRQRAPRRAASGQTDGQPRIPLHEEITAVLSERGPMTAADLASAITERGRYVAQRTTKPLDANQVNSRVSHPHYRARFVRQDGRIALAEAAP